MERPKLEKDIMVSATVCAEYCQVTARRLQQTVKEGWMPRASRGKYPLIQCMYAQIEYHRKMREGDDTGDLHSERVAMARIDRQRKEMELQREQGFLVDVRAAAHLWNQILAAMKQKLAGLPSRAAPMVKGKKTVKEIRGALKEIVQEAIDECRSLEPADYHDAGDHLFDPTTAAGSSPGGVGRPVSKTKPGGKRGTRTVAH